MADPVGADQIFQQKVRRAVDHVFEVFEKDFVDLKTRLTCMMVEAVDMVRADTELATALAAPGPVRINLQIEEMPYLMPIADGAHDHTETEELIDEGIIQVFAPMEDEFQLGATCPTTSPWIALEHEAVEFDENYANQIAKLSQKIECALQLLESGWYKHFDARIRRHLTRACECCVGLQYDPGTGEEMLAIYALHEVCLAKLPPKVDLTKRIHHSLQDIVVMCACRDSQVVHKVECVRQVERAYSRTGIQPDWQKLGLTWWKLYGEELVGYSRETRNKVRVRSLLANIRGIAEKGPETDTTKGRPNADGHLLTL